MNAVSGPFLSRLAHERLLAIIRGTDSDAAVRAALVLLESGIRILEISLVTSEASRVIAEIVRLAPDTCVIGAGTVRTPDDVARASDVGARFMVTPAMTAGAIEAIARGIPVLVGALTPTEAVAAHDLGATAVKLFPASVGGPAYLRALREPLPDIPFVPVGGIDVASAAEYLDGGAAAVGLGGPLVGDAARGGDLDALRTRAATFLAVAREPRRLA